ncbi:hypothetical protein D3C76_975930 [compost metagenome]
MAQRHGDVHGQAQAGYDVQRLAQHTGQRLAAGVIEQQAGLAAFTVQRLRAQCPGAVQFVAQAVLVGQPFQSGGQRMFSGRAHQQHAGAVATGWTGAAEYPLSVVPQDLLLAGHRLGNL